MSQFNLDDTIAAIASPPGPAMRGIVRLSGPNACSTATTGFTPADGFPADRLLSRSTSTTATTTTTSASSAFAVEGTYRVAGFERDLPARLLLWPGASSYTGQPSAEIHTLGNPSVLQLVLSHVLVLGARLAEPGEFTLRAFLSGRIDLTEAEAVLGVIQARNAQQLDVALEQLAGGLSRPLTALRERLIDLLAHLEATLDFTEEPDVDELGARLLAAELERGNQELMALSMTLQARNRADGAPRVVLLGPPNVGKSLLFNTLLGGEHAIVSPVAGTTRDYLSGRCRCDGMDVEVIDTAGLDANLAVDELEALAQSRGLAQAGVADLILWCQSADVARLKPPLVDCPILIIWTKSDHDLPDSEPGPGTIATSALSGEGIDTLRHAIATTLRSRLGDGGAVLGTAARCGESLLAASSALNAASTTLQQRLGDDLVALDLRLAIDELGKVVGEIVTEDLLDRIFSRFCIGK